MHHSFDAILAFSVFGILSTLKNYLLIILGFSLVIFFHELGHFMAAKWCDVRVDRFAVGFGKTLMGYRKGVGFAWGSTVPRYNRLIQDWLRVNRPNQVADNSEPTETDIAAAEKALGISETEYAFNLLPLGGYVKMLGQEDFEVDKSGELVVKDDPRAFSHKPVGQRMIIVSAGVVMNLIFASVIFMLVFMIGMEAPAAKIGLVWAESPAEKVGLQVGDVITQVDNQRISDFNDVLPAVMLSDPGVTLKVTVNRTMPDGRIEQKTFDVPTQRNSDEGKLMIGVAPPFSNKVVRVMDDPRLSPDQQVEPGDVIESINGQKVTDLFSINQALAKARSDFADLKVQRTAADGTMKEAHVKRRARLVFRTTGDPAKDTGHLLGFVPRREINGVSDGEPASDAGLRAGDVIVRWGLRNDPLREEILQSIQENSDRDIPVTLLRPMPDGSAKEISTKVKPHATGLLRDGKPRVGMDPTGQETDRLVISDIVPKMRKSDRDSDKEEMDTPAAALKSTMPRGALITKVNDQPVKSWPELVQRFIDLGGKDAKISWTYNDTPERSEKIHIPQTLGTTFSLLPGEDITKIAGETSVENLVEGHPIQQSAKSWQGARELLRNNMSKTVEVEYRYPSDPTPKKATITVTPEMLDTWVQRVDYVVIDTLLTGMVMTKVRVHNPITAMRIGLQKTYYFVEQVYTMGKRMIFTRSVKFDQMSGPVGIMKMGSEVAAQDYTQLLYFLAVISANLALINFLPLPIVDGGLFMFLIIEKIKGSPISLRVMVATQVIGIVLIIGVFIFVTFQDLQKLFG